MVLYLNQRIKLRLLYHKESMNLRILHMHLTRNVVVKFAPCWCWVRLWRGFREPQWGQNDKENVAYDEQRGRRDYQDNYNPPLIWVVWWQWRWGVCHGVWIFKKGGRWVLHNRFEVIIMGLIFNFFPLSKHEIVNRVVIWREYKRYLH